MDWSLCEECNQKNTGYDWCKSCNAKRFQQNFEKWTSGNVDIDKFIQGTQLSADCCEKVLEWIPYDRFCNIKYIAKGGFGKVYRANWIDGYIHNWDNKNQNWERRNSNMLVALKSLNNSQNVTSELIKEITFHHKFSKEGGSGFITQIYGISQDTGTKNYMMVLDYAKYGSLRNYLDKNYDKLTWKNKFVYLWDIAVGLGYIHKKELIHRDLHIGNILSSTYANTYITDMGLCKPADYNKLEHTNNHKIYGVLPYIAPEILRGQNYTKASDIYSFGIIMYEVISGLPPYHDISHDHNLATKICLGFRPTFDIKVPQLIVHLIKRCLDANPLNRPTAKEVYEILGPWWDDFDNQTELQSQIKEADEINNKSSINISSNSLKLSYETHSEAIYTSRLLDFNNLPQPKNSDDYYEQNDNIISEKYSESLKIDISQWKFNIFIFYFIIILEFIFYIIGEIKV